MISKTSGTGTAPTRMLFDGVRNFPGEHSLSLRDFAEKGRAIQLTGHNLSGVEADRLGLVSMAVEAAELKAVTRSLAEEIATRHPAALASANIAVQMGANLTLPEAMKMDQLVGAWQHRMVGHSGPCRRLFGFAKRRPKAVTGRPTFDS
jgi:enoyl-CoA hydratase/carnithine racemase